MMRRPNLVGEANQFEALSRLTSASSCHDSTIMYIHDKTHCDRVASVPAERAGREHDRDGRRRRGRSRGAAEDGGRRRHGGGGQGLHLGPVSELAEHGRGPAEGKGLGHHHRAEEQSGGEVLRHVKRAGPTLFGARRVSISWVGMSVHTANRFSYER